MKKKVYLASPFGFSEAGRLYYSKMMIPAIENAGFDVLDPWKLTDKVLIDSAASAPYGTQRREAWRKVNIAIGENNTAAIRLADLLVAVLDGPDVDSGTAAEVGCAFGLGKTILGYRNDFRLASDNEGCLVNLQVEYFVLASGGQIAPDLATLCHLLEECGRAQKDLQD